MRYDLAACNAFKKHAALSDDGIHLSVYKVFRRPERDLAYKQKRNNRDLCRHMDRNLLGLW